MLLNKIEFFLMNNPVRAWVQERVEMKNFLRLVSLPEGKAVLEIGCGNGNGSRLINKYFKPESIHAIDLDSKMIERAKKRDISNVTFEVGDASQLQFDDEQFDAIFDFGIIHHIPNWKDCLNELKRVLKPGGQMIIEELSLESFETFPGKIEKRILEHPYEDMFRADEFVDYLKEMGIDILHYETHHPMQLLKYIVVIGKK